MKKISIFECLDIVFWEGVNVNIDFKYVILEPNENKLINRFSIVGEGKTEQEAWEDAEKIYSKDILKDLECYEVFIPYQKKVTVTMISKEPLPETIEGLALNWDRI
jgi:hypothetical protein